MTKDDPNTYFDYSPHKFYIKTKFNLAPSFFNSLTTSLMTQLMKNLVPGVLLFVFCVRLKPDVNEKERSWEQG